LINTNQPKERTRHALWKEKEEAQDQPAQAQKAPQEEQT
jgi:hypothetical protein